MNDKVEKKEGTAVDSVGAKNATTQKRTENPTVAKFAIVQKEGERTVTRQVEYYNLDMILFVGYRVKSNRGIQFRRWANQVLKQYLINGYSINRHLIALQQQVTAGLRLLSIGLTSNSSKWNFWWICIGSRKTGFSPQDVCLWLGNDGL